MLKPFAAAGLAAALALFAPAACAQDSSGAGDKTMSTMAPKKPMMKHHSSHTMHKKPTKTNMQSDTMKSGETQEKM